MSEASEQEQGQGSGGRTRTRQPRPAVTENGDAAASAPKRGRKPKADDGPPQLVIWTLYLRNGREVNVGVPPDISADDIPFITEQFQAYMNLLTVQAKARGE